MGSGPELILGCVVEVNPSEKNPWDVSCNTYKVYWSDGAQVLPPHDAGIIACVRDCDDIPVADWDEALAAGTITLLGAEFDAAYRDAVSLARLLEA